MPEGGIIEDRIAFTRGTLDSLKHAHKPADDSGEEHDTDGIYARLSKSPAKMQINDKSKRADEEKGQSKTHPKNQVPQPLSRRRECIPQAKLVMKILGVAH